MLLCLVNKKGVCFSYLTFPFLLFFFFLPLSRRQEPSAGLWVALMEESKGGRWGLLRRAPWPLLESGSAFFVCVSYDWEHIGQGQALPGSLSPGSPQLLPLLRTAAGAWPPRERSHCEMTLHCPQQGVTCMPPAVPSVPLRTPKHAHRYCTRPPRTNYDPLILPVHLYELHTFRCSNSAHLCVIRTITCTFLRNTHTFSTVGIVVHTRTSAHAHMLK